MNHGHGHLLAYGGNNTSGPIDVATARNACASASASGRMDLETETFITQCVTGDVTHALKAEGADASEDGTGRGNPIVPVAFSCKDCGNDAQNDVAPTMRAMGHSGSHANAGGQLAVAFHENQRAEVSISDIAGTVKCAGGKPGQGYPAAMVDMKVRRLTPVECERLQGFPDQYTNVPHRGKPAADGPRYKALGNSMAVPCMAWIGRRISAQLKEAA
ncbi:MAG: DNA cytosine methyltransferase [Ralstonia sp.]|nr:DNA cytosine methyltransferase [Ralstonia sp.]